MTKGEQAPVLSVVVALVSGKVEHLEACFKALEAQKDPPPMEILVPYDKAVADVATLESAFPKARFILAEDLDTREARRSGASREHHDTLRTVGIRNATGRIIALTEDHAKVSETWCEGIVTALDSHPTAAAIGGAVECDSDRLLNWAVYYCDFGRYQNPLPKGPAKNVSDSNVGYRRDALESIRNVWEPDYHETVVHAALVERGHEMWLTPTIVVWQARGELRLKEALRERYVWGRSFAGTRVSGFSVAKRLAYSGFSAFLPFLMTHRLARGAFIRGDHNGTFLKALPLIFLLTTVWAAGEFAGYFTGRPE
jgi:hypothetical protein